MDDDGEDRAGSSLRSALRKAKAKGVAVVVARWYGGVNIGKARFRHVQERATALLYALGHKVRASHQSRISSFSFLPRRAQLIAALSFLSVCLSRPPPTSACWCLVSAQPGGDVLSSSERTWVTAGVGYTLSSGDGSTRSRSAPTDTLSGEVADAAAETLVGQTNGGGIGYSGASELELRRARAAAAAQARWSGAAAAGAADGCGGSRKLPCHMATEAASECAAAYSSLASANAAGGGVKRQREHTLQPRQQPQQHQQEQQQEQDEEQEAERRRRPRPRQQEHAWICGRCTLINGPAAAECAACAGDRPALSSAGAANGSGKSSQIATVDLVDSSDSEDDED